MFRKNKYVALDGKEFDYEDECKEYDKTLYISNYLPREIIIDCDLVPIEYDDVYEITGNYESCTLSKHYEVEYIRLRKEEDFETVKKAVGKLCHDLPFLGPCEMSYHRLFSILIDIENMEHHEYPDVLMIITSNNKECTEIDRKAILYSEYKKDRLEFFDAMESTVKKHDNNNFENLVEEMEDY